MATFNGQSSDPASFYPLQGTTDIVGRLLSPPGLTQYFLTAVWSTGNQVVYWVDTQVSTQNAPVGAGTLSGLQILGSFQNITA